MPRRVSYRGQWFGPSLAGVPIPRVANGSKRMMGKWIDVNGKQLKNVSANQSD